MSGIVRNTIYFDGTSTNITTPNSDGNVVLNVESLSGALDHARLFLIPTDEGDASIDIKRDGNIKWRLVSAGGSTDDLQLKKDGSTTVLEVENSTGNVTINQGVYKSSDGSSGITQSVNTGATPTLTVKNGIITAVA